ncbi:MAG: type II toxin-antitoxin system HicB family antitoxin [Candidatus Eremiobacteraeota bacterium]|nr:type II toxin-antitoxin system HicB family antitoxin [Candidatus Eremiobacteraeota bacterium]
MIKYPARVEKDEPGYYAQFIDIPGAFTQGMTMEELMEMAEDALNETIAYMMSDNIEIPEPSDVQGEDIIYVKLLPEVALPLSIKKARKELKASQGKIAQRIKVPYQSYQRWERAEKFNPTLKTLERIAKALNKKIVIEFQ